MQSMAQDKEIQFGALRIFVAVAESETLTGAAQKLGVTQSAVSQAITQLEALTKTSLVARRSKPIRLTPAGEVMKEHAQRILKDTRRMLQDVATAATGDLPRLTIGIIDSFADAAGQELMERIAGITPRLSLQTGLAMPLSEALLDRELDILISSDPLEDHPELECHPLLRDPFVLLVAESLCAADEATPEKLSATQPFIRYTRHSRLGKLTDLVMRRVGVEPETRFELDSTRTLVKTVHAGKGWAVATSLCLAQHPDLLEGVHMAPLAKGANARYLCLLARRDELGDTPTRIAAICREIYRDDVLQRVLQLMPWLQDQATAIDEAPAIWSG
jgi:DNA-binding transcriptional LysR family regulator